MKRWGILLSFLFFISSCLIAQPVLQDGIPSDMDSDDIFYALLEGEEHWPRLSGVVRQSPDQYEPPVLYAMANKLFMQDEKKAALFWYCLAQIRSLYAKNLAKPSLHAFGEKKISLYGEYFGKAIEAYAFSNTVELQEVINMLKQYLRLHKENYNLLWVYTPQKQIYPPFDHNFEPLSEWENIRKRTFEEYFENVQRFFER